MEKQNETEEIKVPVVRHLRAQNFAVHPCSGICVNRIGETNQFEISFYADRFFYSTEKLKKIEGKDNKFESTGTVESEPIREHATGVKVSLENLKQFRDLFTKIIADVEKK